MCLASEVMPRSRTSGTQKELSNEPCSHQQVQQAYEAADMEPTGHDTLIYGTRLSVISGAKVTVVVS